MTIPAKEETPLPVPGPLPAKAESEDPSTRMGSGDGRKTGNRRKGKTSIRRYPAGTKKTGQSIEAPDTYSGLQPEEILHHDEQAKMLAGRFGAEAITVEEFDEEGEVFVGWPDQVEVDVIIRDDLLIVCECILFMSKSDMYIFGRKARFYERRHQRKADRVIAISPMVEADERVRRMGEDLGIEMYVSSWDVPV